MVTSTQVRGPFFPERLSSRRISVAACTRQSREAHLMQQLTLGVGDLAASTTRAVDLCSLCHEPAHVTGDGRVLTYCRSNGCGSRIRICQSCGDDFDRSDPGAGTKYCGTVCKATGYRKGKGRRPPSLCAWCGGEADRYYSPQSGAAWPYICRPCTAPIRHLVERLRRHHVPHERARQLLDDPSCEVCGRDIVTKVRAGANRFPTAPLVVDHDHSCCPGTVSCGKCVRGLICDMCNSAAGFLCDDPMIAEAIAAYLRRDI